jgi:predicted metal-dependent hydrolase
MDKTDFVASSSIVVRRIPFEFPDDIAPHWIPGEPELSHMINGASLTMPYLEPFLIRTTREALPLLADPKVRANAVAFMAQEGQHFRAHRRFNDLLKRKGYPELAVIEAAMEASYEQLEKLPLARRLAYAAGFESMTIGLTDWVVGDRRRLFAGADARVASFVLWHMVEETEHKTVAFDVYRATQSSYLLRAIGVLHASIDVIRFSMRGYKQMLRTDGLWVSSRSRLRLAYQLGRFLWHVMPSLLRALLPGHDPRRETDNAWTLEWIRRHSEYGGRGNVPLIDTNNPEMPVPFTTIPST